MANRLFTPAKKLGTLRSLGKFFENIREYSNHSWRKKNTYVEQIILGHLQKQHGITVWPDPNLGCLAPKDIRLTLPGNIGLAKKPPTPPTQAELKADKHRLDTELSFWNDLCDSPTSYNRQMEVMKQDQEIQRVEFEEMAELEKSIARQSLSERLECRAFTCPDLLRKELAGLFPGINISQGTFTVITFAQKSKNDMSCWDPSIEDERDNLMEVFVEAAKDLCNDLRKKSQWADFVEPNSGKPFYGPHTNLTFFETDERYRYLGFRIEDLGCCKVISHHKWGTHAFVGSIFTTAPIESDYLQDILDKCNNYMKSD